MPSVNVTVTAKVGPAQQMTAKSFNPANKVTFDLAGQTLTVEGAPGGVNPSPLVVDFAAATTIVFTLTGAGGNGTCTIT